MKTICLALILALAATTARAQSPQFTNADLGRPHARVAPLTPEQFAEFAAHQYVYTPPLPAGPTSIGIYSSPTAGPFGEFAPFSPSRRLDGSLLSDPYWGLYQPWYGYTPFLGSTMVTDRSFVRRDQPARSRPPRATPTPTIQPRGIVRR